MIDFIFSLFAILGIFAAIFVIYKTCEGVILAKKNREILGKENDDE